MLSIEDGCNFAKNRLRGCRITSNTSKVFISPRLAICSIIFISTCNVFTMIKIFDWHENLSSSVDGDHFVGDEITTMRQVFVDNP